MGTQTHATGFYTQVQNRHACSACLSDRQPGATVPLAETLGSRLKYSAWRCAVLGIAHPCGFSSPCPSGTPIGHGVVFIEKTSSFSSWQDKWGVARRRTWTRHASKTTTWRRHGGKEPFPDENELVLSREDEMCRERAEPETRPFLLLQ